MIYGMTEQEFVHVAASCWLLVFQVSQVSARDILEMLV